MEGGCVTTARCGCTAAGCACAIIAGTGTTVTGTGSSDNPFIITSTPTCDPDTSTCLSCGPDGVGLVFDPATDDCLNCGPNGIRLVIAPEPNALECTPTGLFVSESAGAEFPFVVVASDGSGDFTSIRTAIQAQTANATLVVKPGTYNDTGAGRVTVPAGLHIIIAAEISFHEVPNNTIGDQMQPSHQLWTYDGWAPAAGSQTWATLIGINASSGAAQVVGNMVALTVFRLAIQNGQITSTGQLFGSYSAPGDLGFAFADSEIQAQVCTSTGGTIPTLYSYRTHFTNFSTGTTTHTFNHAMTGGADDTVWDVRLVECVLSVGDLSWSGNTGDSLGWASIEGCHIGGTAWRFNDPGKIVFSNCNEGPGILEFNNSTAAGAPDGVSLVGNQMRGTFLSVSGNEQMPVNITGNYGRAEFGGINNIFNKGGVQGNFTLTQAAGLILSGDQHLITVVFENTSTVASFALTVSGNDNTVIYRGSAVVVTDTGTGNYINCFPPCGTAGGDLSGTFPNPTLDSSFPRGTLDYTQTAASVTFDAETVIVTAAPVTIAAGRRIKITAGPGQPDLPNNDDQYIFRIKEGATVLMEIKETISVSPNDGGKHIMWIGTPTAGAHTYSTTLEQVGGAGLGNSNAAATSPAYILIEDIGI